MPARKGTNTSFMALIWREVCGMEKYRCIPCGYVYDPQEGDPDSGIEPGTSFADLPEDWVCPLCGADKSLFEKDE